MISFLVFDPASGLVVRSGEASSEAAALIQGGADYRVLIDCGAGVHPSTHYVRDGAVRAYTDDEIRAQQTLPSGFVWKMPERVAIDLRTAERQAQDAAQSVLAARGAAYPPAADLADALYWQARGDDSKMLAYLARCDEVKAQFPKAGIK